MKKSTLKSIRRAKNVNVAAKKATIGAQTLKLSVMLMFILSSMNSLSSQVLISSDSGLPDNSAMLEVERTTQGFLPPRMTTSERDAISSPTEGLVIYNMDK